MHQHAGTMVHAADAFRELGRITIPKTWDVCCWLPCGNLQGSCREKLPF